MYKAISVVEIAKREYGNAEKTVLKQTTRIERVAVESNDAESATTATNTTKTMAKITITLAKDSH